MDTEGVDINATCSSQTFKGAEQEAADSNTNWYTHDEVWSEIWERRGSMEKKLKPHEILADKDNIVCICPDTDCEWHGNCTDCVALHRYHATIPNCLEIKLKKNNPL